MDFGVAYFPTAAAVPPDELARIVEGRGQPLRRAPAHPGPPRDRSRDAVPADAGAGGVDRATWREDEATHQGRQVNLERIWIGPRPPHPPIIVGGEAPGHWPRLRRRLDRGMVTVTNAPADPEVLEQLAAAGCSRAASYVHQAGIPLVEGALDGWERAITDWTREP